MIGAGRPQDRERAAGSRAQCVTAAAVGSIAVDRRSFLLGAAATAVTVAGCGSGGDGPSSSDQAAGSTPTTAPAPSTAPTTTAPSDRARFVVRGPDSSDAVALTFHTDGALPIAQRLLDGLRGRATVTCFMIGSWLDANPTWARKLLDDGHELANHTWTHPGFASLAPAAMTAEIVRCRDLLVKLTGSPGRYFRPSGTDDGLAEPSADILRAAKGVGYDTVLGWDVEPFDYKAPGGAAVRTRVLDTVRGGSIVSLHFGHAGTADALPGILDGLVQRKLRPVTVSELLQGR
jgi:peptidoglycan/xylan/chitin deacetylase (PgdA/CDA1 family)